MTKLWTDFSNHTEHITHHHHHCLACAISVHSSACCQ